MKNVVVKLAISAEEFQRIYHEIVKDVVAISMDGRRIRFPVSVLRPFVLHAGVHGIFQIDFDESNRFQGIKRLQ